MLDDALTLRIVDTAWQQSKDARRPRLEKNRYNWDALHGRFDWLTRKMAGQSREVLPSLTMGLEQLADTLSRSLVALRRWFTVEVGGVDLDLDPALQAFLGSDALLDGDTAQAVLAAALDRLWTPGNAIETLQGPRLLVYLACKYGLVEAEWVAKVSMVDHLRWVYRYRPEDRGMLEAAATTGASEAETYRLPGVPVVREPVAEPRLKVELVPFEDFYPDPSPSNAYCIHEVDVHVSELGAYGFDPAAVERVTGAAAAAEVDAAKDARGADQDRQDLPHRVRLREYWGDFCDPDTGEALLRNGWAVTAGSVVLRAPAPNPWWHGRRPFIRCVLMPTVPSDPTHPAFMDWAIPLFSTECELTNLVIDGGFASVHGVREIDTWKYENPEIAAGGLTPGLTFRTAEGRQDGQPGIRRVDTGMLAPETLQVLDRIARIRQEAMRVSDLQLGQFPQRSVKATEVLAVEESTDLLFREIAARFEDHLESLLELCWLTLWQGLDTIPPWIAAELDARQKAMFDQLGPAGRFVALANGTRVRVAGLQQSADRTRDLQKYQMLFQSIFSNPAVLDVFQREHSPAKLLNVILQALMIDAEETKRDPDELPVDPRLLAGQAGSPLGSLPPQTAPATASALEGILPPNALGERGGQIV